VKGVGDDDVEVLAPVTSGVDDEARFHSVALRNILTKQVNVVTLSAKSPDRVT
jgi:hypothetical protein